MEEKIAELKKRWPAHSVPPALIHELEGSEEELAEAMEQARQEKNHTVLKIRIMKAKMMKNELEKRRKVDAHDSTPVPALLH